METVRAPMAGKQLDGDHWCRILTRAPHAAAMLSNYRIR